MKIIIVEDNDSDFAALSDKLAVFSAETNQRFDTVRYSSALKFLDVYKSDADIVFMDIELPDIDGLEASARLRKIDHDVALVFVTNMAQLAIKGYEVEAIDFIVKPINRFKLSALMKKLIDKINAAKADFISIKTGQAIERVSIGDIIYVEIEKHRIVYHTVHGDIANSGTMADVEKLLPAEKFLRCYQSYAVNLKYVTGCGADMLKLSDGAVLPISRARRKDVIKRINEYFARYEG